MGCDDDTPRPDWTKLAEAQAELQRVQKRAQSCGVPDWHRVVRVTYEGTARFWYDDGRPAWELPGIEEEA